MHAIHRHHLELPRAVLLSVVVALLAIAITLAFATGLGDVSSSAGFSAHHAIAQPPAPAWTKSPFAPLITHPVSTTWMRLG